LSLNAIKSSWLRRYSATISFEEVGYFDSSCPFAGVFKSHPHHGQKLILTEATGLPPIWQTSMGL
jgi:hypothetical protein